MAASSFMYRSIHIGGKGAWSFPISVCVETVFGASSVTASLTGDISSVISMSLPTSLISGGSKVKRWMRFFALSALFDSQAAVVHLKREGTAFGFLCRFCGTPPYNKIKQVVVEI